MFLVERLLIRCPFLGGSFKRGSPALRVIFDIFLLLDYKKINTFSHYSVV